MLVHFVDQQPVVELVRVLYGQLAGLGPHLRKIRHLEPKCARKQLVVPHAIERARVVDLQLAVWDDRSISFRDGQRQLVQQRLGQVEHRPAIAERLVGFQRREFGVVRSIYTFVTETAIDFVHARQTTHEQTLQVQLRRDAKVQVDVQRVVMRDERPGRGAAGDRLHHRRLDLQIPPRLHETPHSRNQLRPELKYTDRLGARVHVHVSVPVPKLRVRQSVVFLRRRGQ